MSVIEWSDPPGFSTETLASRWFDDVVATLKSRPGEWALVRHHMTTASLSPFRKRGCEVAARTVIVNETKGFDLYARWPADEPDSTTYRQEGDAR